MRGKPLAWVVMLSLALTGTAAAQTPAELKRAQALYDEGDKLEVGGDCSGALGKFREALKIVETPQLRLRAGRCEEKLGHLLEAADEYEHAVAAATDEKLGALAKTQRDGVIAKLGTIAVEPPAGSPTGLAVALDGRPWNTLDKPQRVLPGDHKVTATASGMEPFSRKVTVQAGGRETVTITLVAGSSDAPPPPEEKKASTRYGVLPWVLVGAGGALTLGGVGMVVGGVVTRNAGFDTLVESGLCPDAPRCPRAFETSPPKDPAWDDAQSSLATANILYGVGGAVGVVGLGLVGAGLGLALTDHPKDEPPAATPAAVVPLFGKGFAGLVVVGGF